MIFSLAAGYGLLCLDLEMKKDAFLPKAEPSVCYRQGKLSAESQNQKMFIGMVDVALGFGFSIISLLVHSEQLCRSRLRKSEQVHGARVQAAEWELLDWCASGQVKRAGNMCLAAMYRNAILSRN